MLTETRRVFGVIAATKSSAEINLSRGATIFNFNPSRSSIGFHAVYCSGNSPLAVTISSPGFHASPYATAIAPALAPLVSAISSAFPPINFAIDARMRFGTSKNVESSFWCGYFFASSAACTARMETFGIGDWPAKFKYVASSISNHSCRQSVCGEVVIVAMGRSFCGSHKGLDSSMRRRVQRPIWAANPCWTLSSRDLEMAAKFAEGRQDHQFSGARHHWFVLQSPGMLVRDIYGVEADLHRRIDVAARAVADHPAVGLHDFVLVNQSTIRLGIFFRNDFDELEKSLQAGPLYLGGLFRGLALRKQNQPVPLREISQRLRHAVQNLRRGALQIDDAAMNHRQRLALRHLIHEFYIRLFQRAPKAAHAVAVLPDVLAFRLIEDVANVRARIAVRFNDADEVLDQFLEEYVVFPQRVVRINQQRKSSHQDVLRWPAAIFSRIPRPTFCSSPNRVR